MSNICPRQNAAICASIADVGAAFVECALGQVIAVDYHPINAKYWTEQPIRQRLKAASRRSRDATATALETDMPSTQYAMDHRFAEYAPAQPSTFSDPDPLKRKPPQTFGGGTSGEPLLTVEDVARRLNVSRDWVWDHSSRKKPMLPVIRMGDGTLRYRRSGIEAFIDERERVSAMRRRAS